MTQYTLRPVNPASPVQENIQLLVHAGQGPAAIVNTDLINSVTIAHGLGPQIADVLNVNNNQVSMITPQTSIAVTGETDVWGINLATDNVAVDVHPNTINAQISPLNTTDGGSQILQNPGGGPYLIYTFKQAGRIWYAGVSMGMGSSGGTGSNPGYSRVYIQGGIDLCVTECNVVGNPDADSNSQNAVFPGLVAAKGTKIFLDVNGAAGINGIVIRGSGNVAVTLPQTG